ncbi:MAG: hypothetical protein CMF50_05555 [Legionellales bacterium]|nr:hypothetical protein [Legionellales bacterium]|tara:strand:+ start:24466 stop:25311 length:846 start_codon:yes stop_codon:yes gene_type:complete
MKHIIVSAAAITLFGVASFAAAQPNAKAINTKRAQTTCSCGYCDLSGTNFSGFAPGSTSPQRNPYSALLGKGDAWLSCNFTGANFSGSNLTNSDLTISIRGWQTPLRAANFNNGDFSQANLSGSTLIGANFADSNFTQANLSNAVLTLANFNHANFAQANLYQAQAALDAMHGWGADMAKVNFKGANLVAAKLAANFAKADFSNANLSNSQLDNTLATINAIQPTSEANAWAGVNFTGANLKGAQLLTQGKAADLSKATLCNTVMPDGKPNNRDCSALKSN